jgi:hypothetical protein
MSDRDPALNVVGFFFFFFLIQNTERERKNYNRIKHNNGGQPK